MKDQIKVEPVPPGGHARLGGHHWLQEVDFDGRVMDTVVLQWNPVFNVGVILVMSPLACMLIPKGGSIWRSVLCLVNSLVVKQCRLVNSV